MASRSGSRECSCRVGKTSPVFIWDYEESRFTFFSFDAIGRHLRGLDQAGTVMHRYVYGRGRISMLDQGTTACFHTDTLGTIRALSDASGAPLAQYDADPYGGHASSSNVDPSVADNPIGYTGELTDPTSGLVGLRARHYDPALGRFFSPDPLGPQNGNGTYTYVGDNPLRYTDPSGLRFGGTCGSIRCWLTTRPGAIRNAAVEEQEKIRKLLLTGLAGVTCAHYAELAAEAAALGPEAAAGIALGAGVTCALEVNHALE